MASVGRIASAIFFVGSVLTLVVGFVHFWQSLTNLKVHFSNCGFFKEGCNEAWRNFFTFKPNVVVDLWTPTVLGFLGVGLHCNFMSYKVLKDNMLYFVFMVVTALFANVGYAGQFGVITAAVSMVGAIVCLSARLLGEAGVDLGLGR